MTSALAALPRAIRRVGLPRIPPRALLAALLALAVCAPAWLWFRDSPLVRVRDVFITGLSTGEGPRIRSALRAAAEDMTTLHVREEALRSAVAAFPSVAKVQADPDFPHKLTIEVVEHVPVALVELDGRRVPAAGSGLLLRGITGGEELPVLRVSASGSGGRLTDGRGLAALRVLAAAPPALIPRLEEAIFDRRGLVVQMREGPELIFGDAGRAAAKWLAAARVLAHPDSAGALYLDLRVPERVAAGGVGPLPVDEPTAQAAADAQAQATATATAAPGTTLETTGVPAAVATPVATATPVAVPVTTPVPTPQP